MYNVCRLTVETIAVCLKQMMLDSQTIIPAFASAIPDICTRGQCSEMVKY